MSEITGTSNRVLEVDLSTKKTTVYQVTPEERRLYLGGKGLGMKLLYDRLKVGIDPLSEDNIIAFMPGVYMGTGAPCSGRFAAVTKSPLTGIMVSASCGGPFGMQLKTAGWDGLILKGKAAKKTLLVVNSKGVEFKDATKLWGKDTMTTQEMVSPQGGVLAIGPAGENLVSFANIASGHRFLGRGGMGAVLGSKNIKAILAEGGDYKIVPVNKKAFDKAKKKATAYINANQQTSVMYRKFGTNANVNLCSAGNILPVNNFQDGTHAEAYEISGENFAEKYDSKYHTCKPCTILCGHKGSFSGETMAIPEYETTGLMGSNLGIFDSEAIARLGKLCGELGMDTISTGGTIAWAMEATEKGLIKSKLSFGAADEVIKIVKEIGAGKGLGKELGLGSRFMSKKYGGEEFAIQVKGLEMAAYDPRGAFGQGLSYAVANRGACHLNAYLVAQEVFLGLLDPYSTIGKPAYTTFFQNLKECIDSVHTCIFTQFAYVLEPPLVKYTPRPLLFLMMQYLHPAALLVIDYGLYRKMWSAITGQRSGHFEFLKAGARIFTLERYMNTREGISAKDDTLPGRMLNEPRKSDPKGRVVPVEKMVKKFYKLRGFDSNGIPTDRTLKRLNIEKK